MKKITLDTKFEDLPETGNPRYKKRIRVCERCKECFVPRGPRARFCDPCRPIHEREKAKERYIKSGRKQTSAHNWKVINGAKRYVHVGRYNQAGENNNNYKNGKGVDWFAKALEVNPEKCNRCGITESEIQKRYNYNCRGLLLHHKDGNHDNSDPSNWEILCKKCHQKHHVKRGKDGRFISHKV